MRYDNAMAESFFATLQLEFSDGRQLVDREAVRTIFNQICILMTWLLKPGHSTLTPFFKCVLGRARAGG